VNIILALLLVTAAYMSYDYVIAQNVNVLGTVEEGSIAEAAGLKEGDTIVSVAGTETADWTEVVEALGSAKEAGNDFEVVYERDGQRQATTVDLPEGETVDIIGVMPTYEPYHMTLGESVSASFNYAGLVASVAVRLIMPQHTMEVLDQSSSVVGISVMAAEAVSAGFWEAMAVIAAISMSLGFMNLLPIPPLDGGKILIEVVQLLMRRPLSTKAQNAVSYVGLAFFLFIFCFALRNDIVRILGL
jgi:regulator of sigma E protease